MLNLHGRSCCTRVDYEHGANVAFLDVGSEIRISIYHPNHDTYAAAPIASLYCHTRSI